MRPLTSTSAGTASDGATLGTMAILEHVRTGTRHVLAAHHAVGRAPGCQLRLRRPEVSSLHAEITWDGDRWLVHDLGSRNGTFVGEHRLAPGARSELLRQAEVAFGDPKDRYRVVDAGPPRLMAIAADGRWVVAESNLMCLPSAEQPDLTVFEDKNGRWVLEHGDDRRHLHDDESVVVGGESWTLYLPAATARTRDARAQQVATLADIGLEFYVSPDQEYVAISMHHELGSIELEPRAHAQLLLALARARLEDAEAEHLSEPEHGWVYREQLARDLGIDSTLLNLWVHRARQQFAKARVRDAGDLVQRRPGTTQIRIGVARLILQGV